MLKTRTPFHFLAKTSVWLALFPTGCSFHSTWETGSSTTSNEEARQEPPAHRHAHGRDQPGCDGPDAERCEELKRRSDERVAQIDRETQERVAQAERDAADEERKADEEAARAREQARAEEEQRARDAAAKQAESQAAASGTQGTRELKRKQTATFIHNGGEAQPAAGGSDLEGALQRRNGEIDQTVVLRKQEIRKKLDRTKADILVAAERKRNEVQVQMKEDAAKQP
jgi:hypothetical protein